MQSSTNYHQSANNLPAAAVPVPLLSVPNQFQYQPCGVTVGGSMGTFNVTENPFNVQSNFSNAQDRVDVAGSGAGTTAHVVYSDGRTATFTCAANGTFQPCTIQGAIADGSIAGASFHPLQLQQQQQPQGFVQKIFRQPVPHNVFRSNDNYAQRKYVHHRPQQQGRGQFVRVPGARCCPYRNNYGFNQNRRYVSKNFNKLQRMDFCQEDVLQQAKVEFQQGFVDAAATTASTTKDGTYWMNAVTAAAAEENKENGNTGQEQKNLQKSKPVVMHFNKSSKQTSNQHNQSKTSENYNNSKNKKLVEPKREVMASRNSSRGLPWNNITYDDISEEESDHHDNENFLPPAATANLQSIPPPPPVHKKKSIKEEVIVKREPGEISDEEEEDDGDREDPFLKKSTPIKTKKAAATSSGNTVVNNTTKKSKNSSSASAAAATTFSCRGTSFSRGKNTNRSKKRYFRGKKDSSRRDVWKIPRHTYPSSSHSRSPPGIYKAYHNHDDRCDSPKQDGSNRSSRRESPEAGNSSSPSMAAAAVSKTKDCNQQERHFSSLPAELLNYNHSNSNGYCCSGAESAVSLKEKLEEMKQCLRDAKDKLLEATVVGSKNSKRLQEEVDKLKSELNGTQKTETELKSSLKKLEEEFLVKSTELGKAVLLYETEKEERAKFEANVTQKFHDRLSIENQKLKAFFDIEVAKMQAFYLSNQSMGYYDGSYYRNSVLNRVHNTPMAAFNNFLSKNQQQINDAALVNQGSGSSSSTPPSSEGNCSNNTTMTFVPSRFDQNSMNSLFMSMNSNNAFSTTTSSESQSQGYYSTSSSSSNNTFPESSASEVIIADSPASPEPEKKRKSETSNFFRTAFIPVERTSLSYRLNNSTRDLQ